MPRKNMKRKGNNKNPNNRKPSLRQREVESVDMKNNPSKENPHVSEANDWRWYAANPQMVSDYASFPFGFPVGTQYPNDSISPNGSAPGSMAFYFTPVFGDLSLAEVAPLNIAMRKFYTFVRHENSGAKNYDAPDLMLYYMAMDSCYTYWSFLKRVAGLLPQYTPYNKYYPKALIQQMGIDFDDVIDNIANFRGFVNQFAYRLNSLRIPNTFAYTARHMWMCDGVYTDSVATKAQSYFYTPSQFWQFNSSYGSTNAGGLDLITFVNPTNVDLGTRKTVSDIISFGNSLLNPLIANEDINIMSGDILKAFGESGCVHLAPIDANYTVIPIYSPEVNSQIENMFIYPAILSGGIKQNTAVGTGYLMYDSKNSKVSAPTLISPWAMGILDNARNAIGAARMLNFHHDGVQPNEVMVATRLANIPNPITAEGQTNPGYLDMTTAGSEVVVGATYSETFNVEGQRPFKFTDFTSLYNVALGIPAQQTLFNFIAGLTDFDWAPNVTFFIGDSTGSAMMRGYTLDVDNYTFVTQTNLSKLSEVALLNMLAV